MRLVLVCLIITLLSNFEDILSLFLQIRILKHVVQLLMNEFLKFELNFIAESNTFYKIHKA